MCTGVLPRVVVLHHGHTTYPRKGTTSSSHGSGARLNNNNDRTTTSDSAKWRHPDEHGYGAGIAIQRLLKPPKDFDGQPQNFENFSYKLKSYLDLTDGDFSIYMTAVEDFPDEVTDAGIVLNLQPPEAARRLRLSRSLHHILVSLCTGSASTLIMSVTTNNGFESWRLLAQRYKPHPMAQKHGPTTKHHEPHVHRS